MTITTNTATGACPSCEASGPIGTPCKSRGCQRQGLHFIPMANAQAHWKASGITREALVGQLVGDFLVVGRLGQGGFGRVLEALQRPLYKLRAAVKLLEIGAHDADTSRRINAKFENEAAILAVLNHPNIVRLLHYGMHHGRPFLAMEFVPGGMTLRTLMNHLALAGRALDTRVLRHVLGQVLDGLEAAHRENIVHRDIKPDNIMLHEVVGNPHQVKLLDFGIAKIIEERRDTSVVMGTIQYMAPEQIEGRDIGPWTDLYALGCIAFEFMTGRRAFDAEEPQAVLRQKLSDDFDPLTRPEVRTLPEAVRAFLRGALARKPGERFQTTTAFRNALDAVFASPEATAVFVPSQSDVADSDALTRIRAEIRELEGARRALEDERGQLDAERRDLEAQRTQMESRLLGQAAAPSAYEEAGATVALAQAPAPNQLAGVQTGVPDLKPALVAARERSAGGRRGLWIGVAAAALIAVGVVIALGSAGGDGASSSTSEPGTAGTLASTYEPAPSAPEPVLALAGEVVEAAAPSAPDAAGLAIEDVHAVEQEVIADGAIATDEAALEAAGDPAEVTPAAPAAPAAVVEATRRLRVQSTPPAMVWVDKKSLGKTPLSLEWPAGEAPPGARLMAPGYRTLELEPSAEDLAAGVLEVKLARLPKPTPPPEEKIKRPIW